MPELDIGNNKYKPEYYVMIPLKLPNLDDGIKTYDHMLHESLKKICSGSSSSSQLKKYRRDPQHNADWKSMIKPILEQEPALSKHFSKEELGKLSLLWIAVLGCYEKSAELLVRSGADVKELFGRHDPQVIDEKWTVLHVLLQMRRSPENERLIRLVTDRGADLRARDHAERTALHVAIQKDRVQMTEMLLEKGADVNAADRYGATPLLFAVCRPQASEVVPLLIKHGADVSARAIDGQNALHYVADAFMYTERARLNADVARILIEKGASLDDEDKEGSQPMHVAALVDRNDLIELYLDHGANVNAQRKCGKTPLHIASKSYDGRQRVKTLLKGGANPHLKAKDGSTALHNICNCAGGNGRLNTWYATIPKDIIRQLLSAGADVLAEDHSGKTPLALISSSPETMDQPGTWLVIEALALEKALQPSIELKDKMIIERNKKLRDYYIKCTDEIDRMKSTRFTECCTFFELLAKRRCQIAAFMRNPDFETKFRLCDLDKKFSIYAEDLRRAFEGAQKCCQSIIEKENLVNEAVYHMLPYLVVKKVVHYTFDYCCNKNVKCLGNHPDF